MKFINKHLILTLTMVFIVMVLANNNLFSYISCNGSGSGYEGSNGGEGFTYTTTIENMIIEAAGYYLQGNSDIQAILKMVELQDLKETDYPGLQRLVNSALENIANARLTYEKLVNKAEATPYNPVALEQLKSFDYKTFMSANRLNEPVFKKVAGFLSAGDITGAFKYILSAVRDIEELLITVKTEMDFARLEPYWQLNERCAETTLFGSFIARVFRQINGR